MSAVTARIRPSVDLRRAAGIIGALLGVLTVGTLVAAWFVTGMVDALEPPHPILLTTTWTVLAVLTLSPFALILFSTVRTSSTRGRFEVDADGLRLAGRLDLEWTEVDAVWTVERVGFHALVVRPAEGTDVRVSAWTLPHRETEHGRVVVAPLDVLDLGRDEVLDVVREHAGARWTDDPPAPDLRPELRRDLVPRFTGLLMRTAFAAPLAGLLTLFVVIGTQDAASPTTWLLVTVGALLLVEAVHAAASLAPQTVSIDERGLRVRTGLRRTDVAWADLDSVTRSAGMAGSEIRATADAAVARRLGRGAGFPAWNAKAGHLVLLSLSGWNASRAAVAATVAEYAGDRWSRPAETAHRKLPSEP